MIKNKIFISYRQSDTQSEASRLKENLEDVFGAENVFFDIETLEPGLNFAEAIEKTIRQSAVVLVLIGESWTKVKDEQGNPRLFKEDDWVRREVALALEMDNTRVIPVLVKDAKKLSADQLPSNIKDLANYQWAELTIPRWRNDVEKLVKVLRKIIPKGPQPPINPNKCDFKNLFKPDPSINSNDLKAIWSKYKYFIISVCILAVLVDQCETDPYPDEISYYPSESFLFSAYFEDR